MANSSPPDMLDAHGCVTDAPSLYTSDDAGVAATLERRYVPGGFFDFVFCRRRARTRRVSPPALTFSTQTLLPDATFEDAMIMVTGTPSLRTQVCERGEGVKRHPLTLWVVRPAPSPTLPLFPTPHTLQFAALNLLFKSIDVSTREPPRVEPSPGGGARVCVATTQRYTLPRLLAAVVVETDLTLTVNASGKVVTHTDTWRRVLLGRVAVPAATAPRLLRSAAGTASTAALRGLGVGGGTGWRGVVRRVTHAHTE